MTRQVIKWIESFGEPLRNEVVIEANEKKEIHLRAKWLKDYFQELVDDAPMVPRDLAEMVLEHVNWESIISHFEGLTSTTNESTVEVTELKYNGG